MFQVSLLALVISLALIWLVTDGPEKWRRSPIVLVALVVIGILDIWIALAMLATSQ